MFNRDEIVARITTLKNGVEEMRVYLKIEERKEREQKAKVEKIKATFMTKALSINKNMGGEQHE